MAVERDRSRTAGFRTVEARLHMHRRAEAARAVARGAGRAPAPSAQFGTASAASAWWRSRVGRTLWWQIARRFAVPAVLAKHWRWMRWFGVGVAAVTSFFVLAACGLWLMLARGPISLDVA